VSAFDKADRYLKRASSMKAIGFLQILYNQNQNMRTVAVDNPGMGRPMYVAAKATRIQSIDLLRGIVMIIMALDHVRDYFHAGAFLHDPTDLSKTTVAIFLTRWITHFCAPVFVFLAGISAYLYGEKRGRNALAFFLLTRGVWLVVAELFIVTLGWTFNPAYPFFNLQVIWATGISMIFLAGLIYLNKWIVLTIGMLLVAGHNLLDNVHVPGHGVDAFIWSLLHEPGYFKFGKLSFSVRYPLLPWIGIIISGYSIGRLYNSSYDSKKRQRILRRTGVVCIVMLIILRACTRYGDAAYWSLEKNGLFTILSFLNVTKYPPSLLYILMTLGPALIFLSFSEKPLNTITRKFAVLGRVPMFYYLVHIFLIHFLAIIAVVLSGYHWSDMILSVRVNSSPQLKGYGLCLASVYVVWIELILLLYPLCKWFDNYKRTNQSTKWWLSYL
jgi:uncharacterized membrane protein